MTANTTATANPAERTALTEAERTDAESRLTYLAQRIEKDKAAFAEKLLAGGSMEQVTSFYARGIVKAETELMLVDMALRGGWAMAAKIARQLATESHTSTDALTNGLGEAKREAAKGWMRDNSHTLTERLTVADLTWGW